MLKQVLEDKEKEIKTVKDQLRQAKEEVVREYHDSDAFLAELSGSYANSFDNCFRQVKASFLNLDLSHVSINAQAQTPAQLVHSESTDELFADDAPIDNHNGDGVIAPLKGQVEVEGEEARPLNRD